MKIEGLQIQGTLCPVFGKQAVTEDKRVEMMGERKKVILGLIQRSLEARDVH